MASGPRSLDGDAAAGLGRFYSQHLFQQILPFWLGRAVDEEYGGYYTCISNSGGRLLHTHKLMWSQGRFVWVWARLAGQFPQHPEAPRYLEIARSGAEFLMRHALLPNGNCAFALDRQGNPILLDAQGNARQAEPGEDYDTSTYADCFVVYGLSEFARVARERAAFDFACRLFHSMLMRLDSGRFITNPYPTPVGYKQHGIPMILLETGRELALTADSFSATSTASAIRCRCRSWVREIMESHCQPEQGIILEFVGSDNEPRADMLGTYINPGHTLESMWFVMHHARETGDDRLARQTLPLVRRACELGWDERYGGIVQFVHRDGGPPRGAVPAGQENSSMVDKLRHDWDTKQEWVHSEALYALLLAGSYAREQWIDEWYWRVHDYTFATFPDPLPGMEWIGTRNRDGSPCDRVVHIPVKDPYHVPRSFMHIIRLLGLPAEAP